MAAPPEGFELGDIRVDVTSGRVTRSGKQVLLEPKAFELLVFFIRQRGRLVGKQELLDTLWAETFVSENAMTRVVAQLRKALGDDAHEPKYIETVPRRGYRFVADVREMVPPPIPSGSKRMTILAATLALLSAVGLWLLAKGDFEEAALPEGLVQVTSSDALDIFPTISPDGNAVAFSSNRDGSFEIYVKQLAPGGEVLRLTSDGAQNFEPAWSPRGEMIAYSSKNRGGIWTVPAFGGTPRRLTDFGGAPAWSPDGHRIVFQSEPLNDLGVNAVPLAPSTLWVCDIDGGPPRQLTKVEEPPGGHGNPSWSPMGDRIAFVTFGKIWTVSLEGEFSLAAAPPMLVYDVAYSPSGAELYFTGHADESFHLWSLDLSREGSEPRRIRRETSPAMRHLSFSADGRKLVYAGLVTSSNLASVSLSPDTDEPVGPPRQLTHYTNHRNTFPRFSPDGRKLAFERVTAGTGTDLWLIDADGRNEQRLTTSPYYDGLPWWSADGRRVIFSAYRDELGLGFWSVDIDSGEETFLRTVPPHWLMGDLSADGEWVAFHSNKDGGITNLWVASVAENGDERQLTFDEEWMGYPTWSPDGELISLEIKRGGDTHVGIVRSHGGTPIQLTNEPGESWPGAWSPDGEKIAFAGWRGDVWNLWSVSRTDRSQRRLTDYTALNTSVRYPTWSPRGDQIVYEYAETTGDIWMLELP